MSILKENQIVHFIGTALIAVFVFLFAFSFFFLTSYISSEKNIFGLGVQVVHADGPGGDGAGSGGDGGGSGAGGDGAGSGGDSGPGSDGAGSGGDGCCGSDGTDSSGDSSGSGGGDLTPTPPTPPATPDLCPNIAGVQSAIPGGMIINGSGDCVTPPTVDICPNIPGDQSTVPSGMVLDGSGNCVTSVTPPTPPSGGGGGGGGLDQPTVSLFRGPTEQPLAFVTLDDLPYTGFESGPLGIAFFWMFVVLWSLFAAYLIAVKRIPMRIAAAFLGKSAHGHDDHASHGHATDVHAMTHVSQVLPAVLAAKPTMSSAAGSKVSVEQFVLWLMAGESDKVFATLRTLPTGDMQLFIEELVCELDDAYRARFGAAPTNQNTCSAVAHLSETDLTKLIETLAYATDHSYGSAYMGAKIALMRALRICAPKVETIAVKETRNAPAYTEHVAEAQKQGVPVFEDRTDPFILAQLGKVA